MRCARPWARTTRAEARTRPRATRPRCSLSSRSRCRSHPLSCFTWTLRWRVRSRVAWNDRQLCTFTLDVASSSDARESMRPHVRARFSRLHARNRFSTTCSRARAPTGAPPGGHPQLQRSKCLRASRSRAGAPTGAPPGNHPQLQMSTCGCPSRNRSRAPTGAPPGGHRELQRSTCSCSTCNPARAAKRARLRCQPSPQARTAPPALVVQETRP